MVSKYVPPEVRELHAALKRAFDTTDDQGRKIGDAKFGVYCFYDFDGEPIYVGQTREKLRTRIRRHLTNQRTDAVAMHVLDVFEVATIRMWPLWDLEGRSAKDPAVKARVNAAEWTVYRMAVKKSGRKAVLNEGDIARMPALGAKELGQGYAFDIAPPGWEERNQHPDIRIARRAQTISLLAKVISERDVSKGLRRTLTVQAERLLHLANERFHEIGGVIPLLEYTEEDEVPADVIDAAAEDSVQYHT